MEKNLQIMEFDKILAMLSSKCDTILGKELAEDLRPVSDLSIVERWQKETTEGCSLLGQISIRLSGVTDIRSSLVRSQRGGTLNARQLREIADNLTACKRIKKQIQEYGTGSILSMTKVIEDFSSLEALLVRSINEEGEVTDAASVELAFVRRQKKISQVRIQRELEKFLRSSITSKYLQENIVTQRNDRYVVPVKIENKAQVPGIVHDQSASGATLFIEPMAVVEANNQLNQLRSSELKEIERILVSLSVQVSHWVESIREVLNIIAELDFILSKARLSLEMDANEPLLNENGYFRMVNARHPLLKVEVVPISLDLGDRHRTMVMTGPNTGGKTVALKTVGLLVLMTQAGLHVPAEAGTIIAVFDSVLADIGDEQNIEQSLSTFSGHMKNIVEILRKASANSIVLLDELGAGTDPAEGAALAMGILEQLHMLKVRTIATTHYSSLKSFAYDHQEMENASVEFDSLTLQPTFRVLQGVAGSSNAFEVASRLGLEEEVIEKAKMFLGDEQLKLKKLMENLEESQRKIHQNQRSMEEERNEIIRLKRQLEQDSLFLEQRKKEIIQKAREEALLIVNQAKRKTESMIKEMGKVSREQDWKKRNEVFQRLKEEFKNSQKQLIDEMDSMERQCQVPLENLDIGDLVFIKSMKQKGRVLELNEDSQEVVVQVGIMKICTDFSDLKGVHDKSQLPQTLESSAAPGLLFQKTMEIKTELDLRGTTLQEAVELVDKYFDDACLAGLGKVYLIHGKGTGALRKGLHEYLVSHNQVESFKLSEYGEGGSGVTVVSLR
ncbi:endonuclease MutS2 [Candidatus Contubernalis alkaliaceticus]|uniref:endonuclease MutS2 n=1 Tax=Candidatus Contubernalis alkaliaceticus TaxID=338645 RepID=UPI001F4C104D|nr:endonuclease MutS2 [Candidatus Contubernalis alkalaceticus]UNC92640.1 endonuclease MutS2 [Candidatus Contubernalis alkalaceticus]